MYRTVLFAFQIDGVQIAVRLKSESLLSKTDLTVGDFVPMTPSGLSRARSLSEILSDSAGNSASLPVLQPIKIYSQDSDDDDVIDDDDDVSDDDVRDDDVIDNDSEGVVIEKMKSPPTRPIRPGPPPKRNPQIMEHDPESVDKRPPVKAKPERPKPFSKAGTSPAGSPSNKRRTPPSRPGRPSSLPVEKTTPSTQEGNPIPPARNRVTADNEAASIVTKPSPPQRPASVTVDRNSVDNEAKPLPPKRPSSSTVQKSAVDHREPKPVPPARLKENMEKQTTSAVISKATTPPQRASFTVEKIDHETKPVPLARPRSHVEKSAENVEKQTASILGGKPSRSSSITLETSTVANQTKPMAPAKPPGNVDKQTDNMLSGKSVTPPPRPVNLPHRPPPPSPGKPITKEKELQPQRVKEMSQVKESEGQSLRQRLGSFKLTRKQQREEVCNCSTGLLGFRWPCLTIRICDRKLRTKMSQHCKVIEH